MYLASEALGEQASLDDHKAQFEAIVFPPPPEPEPEEEEEVVAAEPEPEEEPEAEAEPEEERDPEIENAREQAREAKRKAGQDPGLIDDIMNGADPGEIMAGIMAKLGLDPEQGAAALEEAQAKNAAMLKEQGLSDEDIAMLFGKSDE